MLRFYTETVSWFPMNLGTYTAPPIYNSRSGSRNALSRTVLPQCVHPVLTIIVGVAASIFAMITYRITATSRCFQLALHVQRAPLLLSLTGLLSGQRAHVRSPAEESLSMQVHCRWLCSSHGVAQMAPGSSSESLPLVSLHLCRRAGGQLLRTDSLAAQ